MPSAAASHEDADAPSPSDPRRRARLHTREISAARLRPALRGSSSRPTSSSFAFSLPPLRVGTTYPRAPAEPRSSLRRSRQTAGRPRHGARHLDGGLADDPTASRWRRWVRSTRVAQRGGQDEPAPRHRGDDAKTAAWTASAADSYVILLPSSRGIVVAIARTVFYTR